MIVSDVLEDEGDVTSLPIVKERRNRWEIDWEKGAWGILHRFSIKEYMTLAEIGLLREDDRIELIEGRIVDMAPIGSSHASCVNRILTRFGAVFASRTIVSVQNPLVLDSYSEPQPDLMLLKPREDFYAERHPEPEDVLLLVEVADTSLNYDKTVKIPLYAKHAIQEVWLLNLQEQLVEKYEHPTARGYDRVTILRGNQALRPQAFPGIALTVSELFGLS